MPILRNRWKIESVATPSCSGKPVVTWSPDLDAARDYVTQGATNPGVSWTDLVPDADWDAAGYRFFRVKVSLP